MTQQEITKTYRLERDAFYDTLKHCVALTDGYSPSATRTDLELALGEIKSIILRAVNKV
jgi:predicted DNA-binding protein YlxM (UPF0122 family)